MPALQGTYGSSAWMRYERLSACTIFCASVGLSTIKIRWRFKMPATYYIRRMGNRQPVHVAQTFVQAEGQGVARFTEGRIEKISGVAPAPAGSPPRLNAGSDANSFAAAAKSVLPLLPCYPPHNVPVSPSYLPVIIRQSSATDPSVSSIQQIWRQIHQTSVTGDGYFAFAAQVVLSNIWKPAPERIGPAMSPFLRLA